jgi:hypothetical protein
MAIALSAATWKGMLSQGRRELFLCCDWVTGGEGLVGEEFLQARLKA